MKNFALGVAALLFTVCAASSTAFADDAEPKNGEETPDRYTVPDGTSQELLSYIEELQSFIPDSAADFFEHRKKAPAAIRAAAEKILTLEKDPASKTRRKATSIVLTSRAGEIRTMERSEQEKLLAEVSAFVQAEPPGRESVTLAASVARGLEMSESRELAARAYSKFGDWLAEQNDEELKEAAEMLQGAGRRLDLIGRPLQLDGKSLDGKKFNIKSLKGKVVLVDFWATWCGPCLEEYPNIKENYDKYHDDGFEVVGVSIDQNRAVLEQYVSENKIPWVTLHDQENDGRHPAMQHYGIFTIPAMFLIGPDGNVVSLSPRGDKLSGLLKEMLGEK